MEPVISESEDPNEEAVRNLRQLFAPAVERLGPDVEPAFVYAWREVTYANPNSAEPDDEG